MMRAAWVVVLVLTLNSSRASAQAPADPSAPPPAQPAPVPSSAPAQTPPPDMPMQPAPPSPPPGYWTAPPGQYLTPPQPLPDLAPGDPDYRSPTIALELSLGLTAAGYGLSIWAQYRLQREYDSGGGASTTTGLLSTAGSILGLVGPTSGHIYAGKTWNPGLKWRLISVGTFTVSAIIFFSLVLGDSETSSNNDAAAGVFAIGVIGSALGYVAATIYEIATAPGAARDHNHRGGGSTITIAPTLGRAPGLAVVGTF